MSDTSLFLSIIELILVIASTIFIFFSAILVVAVVDSSTVVAMSLIEDEISFIVAANSSDVADKSEIILFNEDPSSLY